MQQQPSGLEPSFNSTEKSPTNLLVVREDDRGMAPIQYFIASDPRHGYKGSGTYHSIHHAGVQDRSQSNKLSPPDSNTTASIVFGVVDTNQAKKTQDIDLVGVGAQFSWFTGPESNDHSYSNIVLSIEEVDH